VFSGPGNTNIYVSSFDRKGVAIDCTTEAGLLAWASALNQGIEGMRWDQGTATPLAGFRSFEGIASLRSVASPQPIQIRIRLLCDDRLKRVVLFGYDDVPDARLAISTVSVRE
jgi:hypothetical protein